MCTKFKFHLFIDDIYFGGLPYDKGVDKGFLQRENNTGHQTMTYFLTNLPCSVQKPQVSGLGLRWEAWGIHRQMFLYQLCLWRMGPTSHWEVCK